VVDHPSVLKGSPEEITDSVIQLTSIEGVQGLDLLAYRYQGNVPELMQSVCRGSDKPVIMAGSIDCEEKIAAVASSGAAGFTVGTAAFQNRFPSEKKGLIGQVETILKMASHYNP
jgi:DhnA family fructose-bisphosphate aldolase class Ia